MPLPGVTRCRTAVEREQNPRGWLLTSVAPVQMRAASCPGGFFQERGSLASQWCGQKRHALVSPLMRRKAK